MRRIGLLLCYMFCISLFVSNANAYVKAMDVVFDDNEDAIYMIGWVYSRITDKHVSSPDGIYKIEINTNSAKLFIENDRAIDRLKLSPNNELLAVIRDNNRNNKKKELLIYNKEKKKLISSVADDIYSYEWSPDSKEIVYIRGEWIERDGLQSSGVYLFNIESKNIAKIADSAINLEWHYGKEIFLINSSLDNYSIDDSGRIIGNTGIFNYLENKLVNNNAMGFQFSLDGRYSLKLSQENIGRIPGAIDQKDDILLDIYDIAKGQTVQRDKLRNIYSAPSDIIWSEVFWVSKNRLIICSGIIGTSDFNIKICDFENDTILNHRVGRVVGTNNGRSKIIVYYKGRFSAIAIP